MIQAMIVTFDLTAGIGDMTREDVEQGLEEVTVRQYARWRPDDGCKFTSYLYPRLRGWCIEQRRRFAAKTRHGRDRLTTVYMTDAIAETTVAPPDGLDQSDELGDLTAALGALPARIRLVLLLLFYEGLDERAAAERLAISVEGLRQLRDAGLVKCRLALVQSR
jgi:RNA polymerase sigma factor (sigma-70 family)